jgi:hypothetical protein
MFDGDVEREVDGDAGRQTRAATRVLHGCDALPENVIVMARPIR